MEIKGLPRGKAMRSCDGVLRYYYVSRKSSSRNADAFHVARVPAFFADFLEGVLADYTSRVI
jgi:hypothetical protein